MERAPKSRGICNIGTASAPKHSEQTRNVEQTQVEFAFTTDGVSYQGLAERLDMPWGKGLVIQTSDPNGKLRDSVCFVSNPEFCGFEEVQCKTTNDLLLCAIDILTGGEHDGELESARRNGLTLYVRLNGR